MGLNTSPWSAAELSRSFFRSLYRYSKLWSFFKVRMWSLRSLSMEDEGAGFQCGGVLRIVQDGRVLGPDTEAHLTRPGPGPPQHTLSFCDPQSGGPHAWGPTTAFEALALGLIWPNFMHCCKAAQGHGPICARAHRPGGPLHICQVSSEADSCIGISLFPSTLRPGAQKKDGRCSRRGIFAK